jgi:hypothetical protein
MTVPTIDPDRRNPTEVLPTDSYRPADPVWVHRNGAWRPGIIESASDRAATVTYRPNGVIGTGVDTITALYLQRRTDPDPLLDTLNDPPRRMATAKPLPPASPREPCYETELTFDMARRLLDAARRADARSGLDQCAGQTFDGQSDFDTNPRFEADPRFDGATTAA